ncbi:MAG TPA: transposase [Nevskiaceae bacterium]|nr:transposase [Nevskiaceae bacterium]
MARLPRLTVPGYPHHLIQRGTNRQVTFRDAEDHRRLLELLGEYASKHRVAIHAYVLMTNHFHLLATPADEEGLPAMMQALGRRYVQIFNRRHGRIGTLWEGRYRGAVVQTDRYLLACMVYLDLNPVRAGMVARPADYPWSSHAHYVGLRHDRLVTPHALVWGLGNTPFAREAAYAALVAQGLAASTATTITDSALKGWALGEPTFIDELQQRTARRLFRTKVGRPTGRKGQPTRSGA